MEIFILIPIVAVIYGWMQSFPAQPAPAEDINGMYFGNGFCSDYVPNDESLFTDDYMSSTSTSFDDDMHLSSSISVDDDFFSIEYGFDQPDMIHELMFNPINSWSDINIYHHDDFTHDMSISDTFSDPFSTSFSDGCSIHNFND